MTRSVGLAIPAYRCEDQIGRVVKSLHSVPGLRERVSRVWIFDNQSPDGTAWKAREAVSSVGAQDWIEVITNEKNIGLGGTHRRAFARAHEAGCEWLVILHGDDQADVADVLPLLTACDRRPELDAVLGSRFLTGAKLKGYSRLRRWGNHALNGIYSGLTGRRIADLGSGLNVFRVSRFSDTELSRYDSGFGFNWDVLLGLIGRELEFEYVPIAWRETDQVSNARTFRLGWEALWRVMKWGFIRLTEKNRSRAGDSL